MIVETVALSATHPPARNVRRHPERQVQELARAVEMFGQTRPIVLDETGTVLVGNGLVAAFQHLGRVEIEAIRLTTLTADQKAKLLLADNRIYDLGADDYDGILATIKELSDFDVPGFDADMLQRLTASSADVAAVTQPFTVDPDAAAAARTRPVPAATATPPAPAAPRVCPACGVALPATL